jgi:hypothetical protein
VFFVLLGDVFSPGLFERGVKNVFFNRHTHLEPTLDLLEEIPFVRLFLIESFELNDCLTVL